MIDKYMILLRRLIIDELDECIEWDNLIVEKFTWKIRTKVRYGNRWYAHDIDIPDFENVTFKEMIQQAKFSASTIEAMIGYDKNKKFLQS